MPNLRFWVRKLILWFMTMAFCFAFASIPNPTSAQARVDLIKGKDGKQFARSKESLRDLDYKTWQLTVYPNLDIKNQFILRVVGYPGSLRFDHPESLQVHSGIKHWELDDITLLNKKLLNDNRDEASEFDISPLIFDLSKNKPLRLSLPGVFSDLPVPPYLVAEWRSFVESQEKE